MISRAWLTNAAWLILQVGIGYLFMNAAWGCWRFPQWTISETSLLFGKYGRPLAYSGMALMGFGGVSIFLGAYYGFAEIVTRAAACALAVFVLCGAKIHTLDQAEARKLQSDLEKDCKDPSGARNLGDSAVFAHVANVNKNRALAAVCLFLGFGPRPDASIWSYLIKLIHLG